MCECCKFRVEDFVMEESVLPLSPIHSTPSDTFMDLDYMDEILFDGCWLEANGMQFSQFDSSTPISPFEPSFIWPAVEPNNDESNTIPSKDNQEEMQESSFPEDLLISQISQSNMEENISNPEDRPENNSVEDRTWWIGPQPSVPVMDRLIRALGYIKDRPRDKDVLIQVWVPVTRGGKRVLTTYNQPFSLDLNCPRLAHYRDISVNFQFVADEDLKQAVGLPGRVFMNRAPEWTPDVRFFTQDEYPRVGHAQQFDVRGTLAVPVLEQGSRSCLGVIEVVLTTQKIQYRKELESVCQALEAVNLKTADVSSTQNAKKSDFSYQAALPEILDVLRSACATHGLPLAQMWVPCIVQGKGGCWDSDDNFKNCISPVELASYIGDNRIQGFREACSEHHLLKGQGVVGKAFDTNQPCFSPDVSACCKTEYPLSHHARMFGLKAAVAIRLRSVCTGSADFVLEFFLPTNCVGPQEQKKVLTLLSATIQDVCRTLRVVTDGELREEGYVGMNIISKEVPNVDCMQFLRNYSDQVTYQESGGAVSVFPSESLIGTLAEASELGLGQQPECNSKEGLTFVGKTSTSDNGNSLYTSRTGEKRRMKENTVTFEVLRQHFAGSLKDAAKNLGVCPTTLKRICRQHGIQRWPSRKIKKVGHSLQKIQRVIDSVQGASSVVQIESLYSNFSELASPNASRTTPFSNSKSSENLKPFDAHPGSSFLRPPPPTSASPSSFCSQSSSSSSSQCCSSEAQPISSSLSATSHEEPTIQEEPDSIKRTKSDANKHLSGGGLKLIPRSQSHTSFCGPDKPEAIRPEEEGKSRERDGQRIKVTYGEDTIRFRTQGNWGYKDLLREISRRFGMEDASGFHLKYLDDDAEWVLLTCDDDLEECIDVCRSLGTHTIKLSFFRDSQSPVGKSFGF